MRQTKHYSLCSSMKNLHGSPSSQAQEKIQTEVSIIWNEPETTVRARYWLREAILPDEIASQKKEMGRWAAAYSVDALGRVVRYWWNRHLDFNDYAELGTCPREAIYPLSIETGRASLPALPYCTQLEP